MRTFPAVLVTGPRQSGKTTLLREELGESHRNVSLERPDVRDVARDDPLGFLADAGERVILDEIQYAPELLHYIKDDIDAPTWSATCGTWSGSAIWRRSARSSPSSARRPASC